MCVCVSRCNFAAGTQARLTGLRSEDERCVSVLVGQVRVDLLEREEQLEDRQETVTARVAHPRLWRQEEGLKGLDTSRCGNRGSWLHNALAQHHSLCRQGRG